MYGYTFPLRDLELRIVGRGWGNKGFVEFILPGEPNESVVLPEKQWAVIAILAGAAKDAEAESIQAFMSSRQLASRLKERGVVGRADAPNTIKTVSNLRQRVDKFAVRTVSLLHQQVGKLLMAEVSGAEVSGAEVPSGSASLDPASSFAKELIARTELGYRINLHPDNLKLDLGD